MAGPLRGARPAVINALLILLAACAPAAPPASGPAAAPSSAVARPSATAPAAPAAATVRMGCIQGASDAGMFIAEDRGYFREQGVILDCTNFASATEMVAPLAAGQLDVGGGAPSAGLGNALSRGITLKIVADKGSTPPGFGYAGIVIRRDLWESGVRTPADLRGRRVILNTVAGSSMEAALDRALRDYGLTTADVELLALAFPDMAAALANQTADVVYPIEPFVVLPVDQGTGNLWARTDEWYPGEQIAVLLYSSEFAEGQRDVGRRFMLAYLRALRDYNDAFQKGDPAKRRDVVDVLIRNTPLKDAALYEKMAMPGLDPNGRVNLQALEQDQEYYLRTGKQQTPIDLTQVVDGSFADWAVQQLGIYR
jgi:NitT/TauT family transport system substrate-binding protein